MAGFITDADKASIASVFHGAMETFFVPIYLWGNANMMVVSEDPNYNRFNAVDQNNLNPENTAIEYIVSGRVLHEHKQDYQYATHEFGEKENNKIYTPQGETRIKVDASGAALIFGAKELQLNGIHFRIASAARPHGLFSGDYVTFMLKRVI